MAYIIIQMIASYAAEFKGRHYPVNDWEGIPDKETVRARAIPRSPRRNAFAAGCVIGRAGDGRHGVRIWGGKGLS